MIVDLLLLIAVMRSRLRRPCYLWRKRNYLPFVQYQASQHQIPSTVARQKIEPLEVVTDEKFLHLQQFVKSLQSCLGLSDVGLEIGFHDLGFQIGAEKKKILSGMSGRVKPGSLLGIMGPSGAGKCSYRFILPAMKCTHKLIATLVRLLMGKLKHTSGTISINGSA